MPAAANEMFAVPPSLLLWWYFPRADVECLVSFGYRVLFFFFCATLQSVAESSKKQLSWLLKPKKKTKIKEGARNERGSLCVVSKQFTWWELVCTEADIAITGFWEIGIICWWLFVYLWFVENKNCFGKLSCMLVCIFVRFCESLCLSVPWLCYRKNKRKAKEMPWSLRSSLLRSSLWQLPWLTLATRWSFFVDSKLWYLCS